MKRFKAKTSFVSPGSNPVDINRFRSHNWKLWKKFTAPLLILSRKFVYNHNLQKITYDYKIIIKLVLAHFYWEKVKDERLSVFIYLLVCVCACICDMCVCVCVWCQKGSASTGLASSGEKSPSPFPQRAATSEVIIS